MGNDIGRDMGGDDQTVPVLPSISVSTDVERCIYEWLILGFTDIFNELKPARVVDRNNDDRPRSSSDLELVSEEFIRGQDVDRTSIWQLQLRRAGIDLSASLCCLHCFNDKVDEIWTRFDVDIVDLEGKVCYTSSGGAHFDSVNVTKFTPKDKTEDRRTNRVHEKSSIWETRIITMSELSQNWDKLVSRNMIVFRLRLYIYRDKPFNQASYIAEFREPVKLCYTDPSQTPGNNNPFMCAVGNLWETRENSDIEFMVEGQIIKAHKFVLSLQSPWMKDLIEKSEPSSLAGQCPIQVKDASFETFEFVIKYLYTGDTECLRLTSNARFVEEILKLSTKMCIENLSKICLTRLLNTLTVDNFAEIASTVFSSTTAPKSFFRVEMKRFLIENQKSLQKVSSFKDCAKNNPNFFLELCFQPIALPGRNETDI